MQFHFEGVQNIAGATVNIDAPDFASIDPAAFVMSRRYNDERIEEDAVWLADKVSFGRAADLVFALRRQSYDIESDRTGAGLRPVAGADATTWMAGVSAPLTALGPAWRAWASTATGMEPNRGNLRDGSFLPPQRSRQHEVGVEHGDAAARATLALWRIDLRHLPMTDPADRTAVISAGARRVQGLEATYRRSAGPWAAQANLSAQRTRQLVRTGATLGDQFVGVPKASGGVQLLRDLPELHAGARLWAGLAAVGPRMANGENTVRVAGYVRVDAGTSLKLAPALLLQAGVRNLGDIRCVESVTALDNVYQGARRQGWIGLRAGF